MRRRRRCAGHYGCVNRIPAIVIVDEIRGRRRGQENITASASTSDCSRKRRSVMRLILVLLLLLLLIARPVAAPAVVTLPFIKRQMVLGLVEGVLQLGDAPPSVVAICGGSDDLDRTG